MKKITLALLTAATLSVGACTSSQVNVPASEIIYFNHNSDIVSPMGIEKIKYFTDINKKHKNTNEKESTQQPKIFINVFMRTLLSLYFLNYHFSTDSEESPS